MRPWSSLIPSFCQMRAAETLPVATSEAPAGRESASPARPIAGDPRAALAAALGEPTRVERVDLSAVAGLRPWIEASGELAVALVPEDPRPLRGAIVALGVAAADGRALATDGPDASEALL